MLLGSVASFPVVRRVAPLIWTNHSSVELVGRSKDFLGDRASKAIVDMRFAETAVDRCRAVEDDITGTSQYVIGPHVRDKENWDVSDPRPWYSMLSVRLVRHPCFASKGIGCLKRRDSASRVDIGRGVAFIPCWPFREDADGHSKQDGTDGQDQDEHPFPASQPAAGPLIGFAHTAIVPGAVDGLLGNLSRHTRAWDSVGLRGRADTS
jgi:hypothetical protein